jgi:hypothetical protein
MRHEPSDLCSQIQPAADRRCAPCQAVKPLNDFSARAGTPAGCCMACRRRSDSVVRRHRQRTLRQVARRAEAGYRALLAQHPQEGGSDAA